MLRVSSTKTGKLTIMHKCVKGIEYQDREVNDHAQCVKGIGYQDREVNGHAQVC